MRPKLFRRDCSAGFTLTEIIIVVVILGVLASLALVRYTDMIKKGREQDAVNQLKAIHAANHIFFERNNPPGFLSGANLDLDAINTNLGLSIFSNGITYQYTGNANSFTATATIPGTGGFTVSIDDNDVSATNPWCSAGSCPTL